MAFGNPNPELLTKEEQEIMTLYEEVCLKRQEILQKYYLKRR
jgi:hypothetical protein